MIRDQRCARARSPVEIAIEAPAAVGHGPVRSSNRRARAVSKATSQGSARSRLTARFPWPTPPGWAFGGSAGEDAPGARPPPPAIELDARQAPDVAAAHAVERPRG